MTLGALALGAALAASPAALPQADCFILYDLKADKVVARTGDARCAERVSPCSTFKVPLALMAFDAGVLTDETSARAWDGTRYSREAWNRDHTAATWMRDSVVWFSQRLTSEMGMEKVRSYLAKLDFGNGDMSGGLTKAWLESSMRISPDEQLRFWTRFWREQLPVSKHAYEMTKKITLVETSPRGWTLHGKTGSGDAATGGWFVGHVGKGDREYVFVTRYVDRAGTSKDDRPAGWIARDIAKKLLEKQEVF
jgi:beta-lactamase class D